MRETEKSSWSAASMTLVRVFSDTISGLENARDTVAVDTPALRATSSMLAFMRSSRLLPGTLPMWMRLIV